jgi:hypothetical protein
MCLFFSLEKNIHFTRCPPNTLGNFSKCFCMLRHLTKISTNGEQQFDGFEIEVSCGAQRGD